LPESRAKRKKAGFLRTKTGLLASETVERRELKKASRGEARKTQSGVETLS
jgi:hypothetical protein